MVMRRVRPRSTDKKATEKYPSTSSRTISAITGDNTYAWLSILPSNLYTLHLLSSRRPCSVSRTRTPRGHKEATWRKGKESKQAIRSNKLQDIRCIHGQGTYSPQIDIRWKKKERAHSEASERGLILIYTQRRGEGRPGIHHLYFNHTTDQTVYLTAICTNNIRVMNDVSDLWNTMSINSLDESVWKIANSQPIGHCYVGCKQQPSALKLSAVN